MKNFDSLSQEDPNQIIKDKLCKGFDDVVMRAYK